MAAAMRYYAIQVKTRGEEKYIRLFKALHPEVPAALYFPKRRLDIRRKGAILPSTSGVFPGYVFVELGGEDSILSYHWLFRRTDGFFRFLKSNQQICPLEDRDLHTVLHFIKIGSVAGKSRVFFDECSRIVVLEGPLKGLEGNIIRVDKRKGRARVKLDFYDETFAIDLGFEHIAAAAEPGGQANGGFDTKL